MSLRPRGGPHHGWRGAGTEGGSGPSPGASLPGTNLAHPKTVGYPIFPLSPARG